MRKNVGARSLCLAAGPCLIIGLTACGEDFEGSLKAPGKFISHLNAVENEYIVVLDKGANSALSLGNTQATLEIESEAERLSWAHAGDIKRTYKRAVPGFVAHMSEAEARLMSQRPEVAYVEENGIVNISATQSNPPWGLDRIDQTSASLDFKYTVTETGQGVTAYIVDTGILATHEDFGNRVRSNGFDAINDGRGTDDCEGHGTHVAGTVGGTQYGVAKNVTLVPVRVLGCNGSGTYDGVIAGIDYVRTDASGPAVANMSLGGPRSRAVDDAVANATDGGVTFVVAAGNSTLDACTASPAAAPSAITVGASTINDDIVSFSNFGPCVDIFAPGAQITSTFIDPTGSSTTETAVLSGTSMASPHVAGVVALYLERDPQLSPAAISDALVDSGVSGAIRGLNNSTPNVLLQTRYTPGGGGGAPDPATQTDTRTGFLNRFEEIRFGPYAVKPGSNFAAAITGTGDADLYVKFGQRAERFAHDCRPYEPGSTESCSMTVPSSQSEAYIMLRGYLDSTFELNVTWTAP